MNRRFAAAAPAASATGASNEVAPTTPPTPPPREGEVASQGAYRTNSIRAQRWRGKGAARVLGPVEVDSAHVQGTVTIEGSLTADTFEAKGTLEVLGTVQVRHRLELAGRSTFSGAIEAGSLGTNGVFLATQPVRVTQSFEGKGRGELRASATAGSVSLSGLWTLRDTFSATGDAEFRLKRGSTAQTLRGARVRVVQAGARVPGRGWPPVVDRIEAEEVELVDVRARFVKATRVILGSHAHAGVVEGEIVHKSRSARAGPESASPPPAGLSR